MLDRDKILEFIRSRGPVIPIQLANEFKQSTIITGAILSGLVKSSHLQLSHVKVGGSPVYYLKEHESRLQDYYKYLNEKDKRSYDLLKNERVLIDSQQTPLVRVSLRNIPDYAKSFEWSGELYWRWFLLPVSEAERIIEARKQPLAEAPPKAPETVALSEKRTEPTLPGPVIEKPVAAKERPEPKIEPQFEKKDIAVQKELAPEPQGDSLHEKMKKYFNESRIIMVRSETIKRNAEIDYVIEVPSAIGPVTYYCKAKNKKRSNEGDLAAAFVKGQTKKLPVLYISTGDFTKKAQSMLSTDFHQMKLMNLR